MYHAVLVSDRRHITVGQRRLSYLESGAGRPLILVHGFPLSAEMWAPQLADPPAGWRIVAPDLRGFGPSPDPIAPRTMEDYSDDVMDLMRGLEIGQAVIGGLSMGGYVVFSLRRRAPQLFQGLVLADTRATADTVEGRAARTRMQALAEKEGAEGVLREMMPKMLSEQAQRTDESAVAAVRGLMRGAPVPAITAALGAMMARPDSTPLLPDVACPALVVVGSEDRLTPAADSDAMHRLLPNADLRVIAGAGHLSNIENPRAFNRALADFLAQKF